jgi:hypothetical protein
MNRRCDFRITRPHVESLEDRTLMSTCHVTRLTDLGIGKGFRGDLRYCINKVDNEPGPDAIDFTVTGTIKLNSALPILNSEVELIGPGAQLLTIDAQQRDRVLQLSSAAIVELSGITLQGGKAISGQPPQRGGGIYNEGKLSLLNAVLTENQGWYMGAGIYNSGDLTILNSTISKNSMLQTGSYTQLGGGIANDVGGVLLVAKSVISNNSINGCFNCDVYGGGISNQGSATVSFSTVSANFASITNFGNVGGFGGGIFNSGELHVDTSLIFRNTAGGDYYGYGGGIANGNYRYPGGNVTVVNSTLTENLAFANGDGFGTAEGGGISSEEGGVVEVRHSTIARNQSNGGASYVTGAGGGVLIEDSQFHLHNSILAANSAKNTGNDFEGALSSSGFNLISNSGSGSGYAPTDILDVDALLDALAPNGGPTETIALLPGSPAIDAGDNTDAPEWDQRGPGFPRIVNGTVDIGAFEVQATGIPGTSSDLAVLSTADFGGSPFKAKRPR